jgi:hypothetical protein
MKRQTKLTVRRTTLRHLTTDDMSHAIGGSLGPTHSDACTLVACLTATCSAVACNK